MLIVETIAKIRRAYFSDCKSIKAICRELRLSRKVVRKVIRSGETSFSYVRLCHSRMPFVRAYPRWQLTPSFALSTLKLA
jgi:hypothetical protein